MSARASPIPALFSLRIPFHSVSLEQHQTINNFSPQLGCVFGLLLSSSSGGFHSVCSPTARLRWRFWPPAWCLPSCTHPTVAFREAGMPCFSPTSRCWPFASYEACIIVIPLTHPYRLCSKFLRPKAL